MKILLAILVLLTSCQTTKDILVPVSPVTFKDVFEDGVHVEEVKIATEGDKTYVYREGHTHKGDCRISRTEIIDVDGHAFLRLQGVTESCSGTTCEHCAFKKTGGCECKNFQGACAHTISRNTDLMRIN